MATKKHVFSPMEKKLMLELLKKYSKVVENTKTDGASSRAKNEAWHSVAREYNANPHISHQVTSKQLRRLWMNMKQRKRMNLSTPKGLLNCMTTEAASSNNGVVIIISKESDMGIGDMKIQTQPLSSLNISSQTQLTNTSCAIPENPLPSPLLPPSPPPVIVRTPPSQSSPLLVMSSTPDASFQNHKNIILEEELKDKQKRPAQLHEMEIELLRHRIREAKAKADLSELKFRQQLSVVISKNEQGGKSDSF